MQPAPSLQDKAIQLITRTACNATLTPQEKELILNRIEMIKQLND